MKKRVNIDEVYRLLKVEFGKHQMPVADLIQAQKGSPYKILIATILSARTKDETTATVVDRLFAVAPDMTSLKKLNSDELKKLIFPVGFYKQKAKYLERIPAVIDEEFEGEIPNNIEDLIVLPGVGRKTANLVVALAFNKPAICVDIHVHRISNRLGYVVTEDPFETEMRLREILPIEYWTTINAYMVSFGQNICKPVNPFCSQCPIIQYCNRVDIKKSR